MNLKLIDPLKLKNLVRVDKDTVTFTVGDSLSVVTVHRYISGWNPHISITIDNIIYHDNTVETGDKAFFDNLINMALMTKDLNYITHRKNLIELVKTTIGYEC